MDDVRLRKLEEKEALLRDTFEDALLCLERDSVVSVGEIRMLKSLATIWMAASHLLERGRHDERKAGALRIKE